MTRSLRWLDARLTSEELASLAQQGFVAAERLPSGAMAYKLRFRAADRRQRVVYLGVDQQLADEVREYLRLRQAPRRRQRQLDALSRTATAALRRWRSALAPVLAQAGYRFHGAEIRKQRQRLPPDEQRDPPSKHSRLPPNSTSGDVA